MTRWAAALVAVLAALGLHLGLRTDLEPARAAALMAGTAPEGFAEVLFIQSVVPRSLMAGLVGAALGLAGSVLQQLTRNRLVSPLTIGAASGAWLALVLAAVLAPALAGAARGAVAMVGAGLATALVFAVAGRQGIAGLPVVLAGMACNILFGALATLVVLTHGEAVRSLFVWGAGDLSQTGWAAAERLALQGLAGLALLLPCLRALTLMRLGAEGAAGRGLAVWPVVLTAGAGALWLAASAVAAVGVIGFVGLLAPNLARLLGPRRAGAELAGAALVGAAALTLADGLALAAGSLSRDLVPTGAVAALIGAPVLILLTLGSARAEDHARFAVPVGGRRAGPRLIAGLALLAVVTTGAALLLGPGAAGWRIAGLDEKMLALRWPRVLAAAGAGLGMAVAGTLLQRLLRNPLASPDIIGISGGASLALVGGLVFFGRPVHTAGPLVAIAGSMAALALLLPLARRYRHAPGMVALGGIALGAALDAMLQLALARAGEEAYMAIGWLAGSTLHVSSGEALSLAAAMAATGAGAAALVRWLDLVALGDAFAAGRGLAIERARLVLLALSGTIAALVTAFVGPVAFVGLLAPHLAGLLGARRGQEQLAAAALIGIALFVLADWAGRTALYPQQLPAGAVAAVLGGAYLVFVLATRRA